MAEEKGLPYKSVRVFYIEHNFAPFLTASLLAFPNRPTWEFTVYGEDKRVAWQGTLQELLEAVLLGAVYKNKLTLQGKEKPCETSSPIIPPSINEKPS